MEQKIEEQKRTGRRFAFDGIPKSTLLKPAK